MHFFVSDSSHKGKLSAHFTNRADRLCSNGGAFHTFR
nr:MAG TPA: hypothetical protein [Caudoviricetes sp.]